MAVPLNEGKDIFLTPDMLVDTDYTGEERPKPISAVDADWISRHPHLLYLNAPNNRLKDLGEDNCKIIEAGLKKNQDRLKKQLFDAMCKASENYIKNYKSSCLSWLGKGLWGMKHGGKGRLATCEKWIQRKDANYQETRTLKELIQEINEDIQFSGEKGGSLAARVARILFPKKPETQTIFQKIGSFFDKSTLKTTLSELCSRLPSSSNSRQLSLEEQRNITDCKVIRIKSLDELDWNLYGDGHYYVQTYTEDEAGNKEYSPELHYFRAKKKEETLIFDNASSDLWGAISKSTSIKKNVTMNDLNHILSTCIEEAGRVLSSMDLGKITAWTKIKPKKLLDKSERHIHLSTNTMDNLKLLLESMPLFSDSKKNSGYLSELWVSLGLKLTEKPNEPLKAMLEILQSLIILNTSMLKEHSINLPIKHSVKNPEEMKEKIEGTFKKLINPSVKCEPTLYEGVRFLDSSIKVAIYEELEEPFESKSPSDSSKHSIDSCAGCDRIKMAEIKEFYHLGELEAGTKNVLNIENLSRLGKAVSEMHSRVSLLIQEGANNEKEMRIKFT